MIQALAIVASIAVLSLFVYAFVKGQYHPIRKPWYRNIFKK